MQQNNTQGAKSFAQDKIHSQMVKAGGKNYFFDVKKASNGNNYLSVTESYLKKDGEKVSNRLIIFKDHMAEFEGALDEAKKFLQ